jgi:hypothetical protein
VFIKSCTPVVCLFEHLPPPPSPDTHTSLHPPFSPPPLPLCAAAGVARAVRCLEINAACRPAFEATVERLREAAAGAGNLQVSSTWPVERRRSQC